METSGLLTLSKHTRADRMGSSDRRGAAVKDGVTDAHCLILRNYRSPLASASASPPSGCQAFSALVGKVKSFEMMMAPATGAQPNFPDSNFFFLPLRFFQSFQKTGSVSDWNSDKHSLLGRVSGSDCDWTPPGASPLLQSLGTYRRLKSLRTLSPITPAFLIQMKMCNMTFY